MNINTNTPQKSDEQLKGRKHAMTTKQLAAWNRMHGIITTHARTKRTCKAMADIYQNDWM
ncbi:MAG: hypothetical protein PHQ22_10510 [Sulfuricurvum sp.]|nr:hypothetical protein [Sulfuricurvum sp.]